MLKRFCLLASLLFSLLSHFRSSCLCRLRLPLSCSRPFLVSPQSRPFRCRSNRGDPTLPLGGVLPSDVAVSLCRESAEIVSNMSLLSRRLMFKKFRCIPFCELYVLRRRSVCLSNLCNSIGLMAFTCSHETISLSYGAGDTPSSTPPLCLLIRNFSLRLRCHLILPLEVFLELSGGVGGGGVVKVVLQATPVEFNCCSMHSFVCVCFLSLPPKPLTLYGMCAQLQMNHMLHACVLCDGGDFLTYWRLLCANF